MKVAVYNDCYTGVRPHFGCDLVMRTFKEQFERVDIEYIGSVSMQNRNPQAKLLEKADLVVVNGEGSFHHSRRNDIAQVSKYFPSILINTVYYNNQDIDLSKFKFISARETRSANYAKCEIIPDIIFTSQILSKLKANPEKSLHTKLMHSGSTSTLRPSPLVLPEIARAETLETESFHGIAVATILGVPIVKVHDGAGVPWKTHSLMSDIKQDPNYVNNARAKINNLFERLHDFQ